MWLTKGSCRPFLLFLLYSSPTLSPLSTASAISLILTIFFFLPFNRRRFVSRSYHPSLTPMKNFGTAPAAESPLDMPMSENSSGWWEKSWETGETPWDLGGPTPIVVHLAETSSLPHGRVLVPGCGTGYDVVAMASPDRHVVGLDVSKTAIEKSSKSFSSLPNAKYFSFVSEDFFTWEPAEKFDLIFDYTFFCAIEPSLRPLWAERMEKLLKPGGELITLMYPIDERSGGPAYKVSESEYEKVLIPLGFEATSIVDNELAIERRKGKEKLGRWKKSSSTVNSTS